MKLTSNKIFSFMLAAAFALTLAGCGGGGAAMDDDDGAVMMCPADQVGTYPDCMEPGPTPEEIATMTKSAGTKEDAIGVEAMDGTGGPGGDDAADIAVAHKDGAVSISVSRGADDDKVDFMKDPMDLTGADDSTGSMNVLGPNDDGETEIAIVYTDIDAPKATKFGAAGTGVMLDKTADNMNSETDENPFVAVLIDSDNAAMVATSAISASGGAEVTLLAAVEDNDQTMDVDETVAAFEADATFNGASGTLMCAGDGNCSATVDADGKITAVTGDLLFTPASVADGGTIDVDDDDYLWYGVWLMKTAQDDGSDEYNQVETFADSSLLEANVAGVTGSASYKGGAAGVYVRNVYIASTTGEQKLDYANSGHFTAKVNLKVYFGQVDDDVTNLGTIAPYLLNTVNGTIDGFTLSGGEDASGWGVDVAGTVADNGISGTAKGGGGDDGSISGNFRGDDTDDDGDIAPPKVLVGEFNAEFTNGSVAGGYGARK